ncbi:hypothetical protein EV667_2202 [Ancylobacter aquaticus]|uniref:Uncharacterized protein n=1 Tax=Ancylobacter aquaticus TaxID=100 RepID=A0A4R1I2N1_ANCAQ|nr:hypothetical protein EV667_2202 [Ancylobacter aquaticus]
MTSFAIDVTLLLVGTYVVGCIGGCWLRRMMSGRRQG